MYVVCIGCRKVFVVRTLNHKSRNHNHLGIDLLPLMTTYPQSLFPSSPYSSSSSPRHTQHTTTPSAFSCQSALSSSSWARNPQSAHSISMLQGERRQLRIEECEDCHNDTPHHKEGKQFRGFIHACILHSDPENTTPKIYIFWGDLGTIFASPRARHKSRKGRHLRQSS